MTRATQKRPRLVLTIPGRPIPLERARVEKMTLPNGKRITRGRTPAKSVAYRQRVQLYMTVARSSVRAWPALTKEPLAVSLWIYWEDLHHGDGSNVLKAIEDAGNGLIWHDDKQIVEAHFYCALDREKPRVEMIVQILGTLCDECRSWQFAGARCPKHAARGEVVG